MKVEKYYLNTKNYDGKTFYYIDIGSEVHGKPSFRLWVNRRAVKFDKNNKPYIPMPYKNANIKITKKGTPVVIPSKTHNIFNIYIEAGYRGSSHLTMKDAEKHGIELILPYKVFHSPRGNLGISAGIIITATTNEVEYKWERTGRTYGKPKKGLLKIRIIDENNYEVENLTDIDPDELDEIDEINE